MSFEAETSLPAPRIQLSPQEWRSKLDPEEYAVLREAATERPFTGEYTDTKSEGVIRAGPAAPNCSAAPRNSTRTAAGPPSSIRRRPTR